MISVSNQESKAFGYTIARGNMDSLDNPTGLMNTLEEMNIDVLKLTLSNTPKDLYTRLDQLQRPYYVLGMTVEYKAVFSKNPVKQYLNTDIEFVEYTGENGVTFKTMVADIFRNTQASYYTNPGLKHVTDEEEQIKGFAEYLSTLNSAQNEKYYTHIALLRGVPAGFVCSYKEGNGGGVSYAGVLKQFEGKGLYLDIVSFIQNHGKSIGQKWGVAAVQIQNTVVQKSFHRRGMLPSGYFLHVHVNSFYGALRSMQTGSPSGR